jgi:hypothetical protein
MQKCNENGINFSIVNDPAVPYCLYHIPYDLSGCAGGMSGDWNYHNCFQARNCAELKNGRIYPCTPAPAVEHLNKYFGTNIPLTPADSIDIYKSRSYKEILDFVSNPIPLCKYCNIKGRTFGHPWKGSAKDISEWT